MNKEVIQHGENGDGRLISQLGIDKYNNLKEITNALQVANTGGIAERIFMRSPSNTGQTVLGSVATGVSTGLKYNLMRMGRVFIDTHLINKIIDSDLATKYFTNSLRLPFKQGIPMLQRAIEESKNQDNEK